MTAAQQYGELADGLRDALRTQYGSDTEGAWALGVATGAAVSVASAVIGVNIGIDVKTLSQTVASAIVPLPAEEVAIERDRQSEAERIGRLMLAMKLRGHDFAVRGYENFATVHVYRQRPGELAETIRTRSDAGSLSEALDAALDRVDRGDWL